nr:MAG TPA: HOLLIDAY JUNCTION RESOLVASE HOMOLOGOUS RECOMBINATION [Caudoviricetes sp.]
MVADYLAACLGDPGIDRQIKTGSADKGDVRGVYLHGLPVAVECKEYGGKHELPQWYREAEAERANRDAAYGVVVWKRKGTAKPGDQHVSMTLATFAAMLADGPENVIEGGN